MGSFEEAGLGHQYSRLAAVTVKASDLLTEDLPEARKMLIVSVSFVLFHGTEHIYCHTWAAITIMMKIDESSRERLI